MSTLIPARQRPAVRWSTCIAVVALCLAVLAAGLGVLAVVNLVDGLRDPDSWGQLAAAGLLTYAFLPATAAITVAQVQVRRGWGSRTLSRVTTWLAAPPLVVLGLLVLSAFVGALLA